MKKRILAVVLICIMIFGTMPSNAMAKATEGNWKGSGTKANPYQLAKIEDVVKLRDLVNNDGITFEGSYFKLSDNITLPKDWIPIGTMQTKQESAGVGRFINPFSGTLDGGNFTLTIPEGEKPLFGMVRDACVENLNIYGTKINGAGLVNDYTVDYGVTGVYASSNGHTIDIVHVTLKSGSKTLSSGFVQGNGSGINTINVIDSTVEKGVTIGYDGNQSCIGSFVSNLNGSIRGCVSYADVQGKDMVGGFVGSKGQSMGPCEINSSTFSGTLKASGTYAGGIIGSGYIANSAPNSPCVSIQNCYVTGTVRGKDCVGGIFGGEGGVTQCWENGIGYIQNNFFYGNVECSGRNAGGLIGLMRSLDRYNVISNNYYLEGCGASKGIGMVDAVDKTHVLYGRNDDPTGKDVAKLSQAASKSKFLDGTILKALNTGLNSSKNWIKGTDYPVFGDNIYVMKINIPDIKMNSSDVYLNDKDILKGKTLEIYKSDGSIEKISASTAALQGADTSTSGVKTVTVLYDNHTYIFKMTVHDTENVNLKSGDKITVSFTLLGTEPNDAKGDRHTLKEENLDSWISTSTYEAESNAKVIDVFAKALTKNGYSWMNQNKLNDTKGNYIQSITKPNGTLLAEFTNGQYSGWMYTLNGKHPELGVKEQGLKDQDKIIFHYTDDYRYEEGSEKWQSKSKDNASKFNDVSVKDWFYDGVKYVADEGLLSGTSANSFAPSSNMTRGMLVTALYRLEGSPDVQYKSVFSDVEKHKWYTNAVIWAYEDKIVSGYGNDTFGTDESITREQMAAIIYNYAAKKNYGVSKSSKLEGYTDSDEIALWSLNAMKWANGSRLINGRTTTVLAPKGIMTRAEAAVILKSFIDNITVS